MQPIIEVKNIGKRYNITHQQGGYIALRDVIANTLTHPFRFLKHRAKSALGINTREEFWALRGVSFNVHKGEVIGIVGSNGAGKSTLLKILTGITPPTEGEITMSGKVVSLLEVGTGFHPELTGRENIFLNGAILGMSKKEIARKFEKIVTFAGIEKFLDTPVKRYSSGMYVRLAFSVAAHLEPDILIVDEVLAVGDAEFQAKCLGKMEEVTRDEGRTIIFVSHNMEAIERLCKKTILLKNGKIQVFGETADVIAQYLDKNEQTVPVGERKDRKGNGKLRITGTSLKDSRGKDTEELESGEDGELWIQYQLLDTGLKDINVTINIDSLLTGHRVGFISNNLRKVKITPTGGPFKIKVRKLPLNEGAYSLTYFIEDRTDTLDWVQNAETLHVKGKKGYHMDNIHPADRNDVFFDFDFEAV
jgi:lipopolysaccharide transport system ATP-binding protein